MDVGCGIGVVLCGIKVVLDAKGYVCIIYEGWDIVELVIGCVCKYEGVRLGFVVVDFLILEWKVDFLFCIDIVEYVCDDLVFFCGLRVHVEWFIFWLLLDFLVLDVV